MFSQKIIEIRPVLYSDYQAFLEEPEKQLYPQLSLFRQEFETTDEFLYLKEDPLCVDSSFFIDTIYSYNSPTWREIINYRRSFSYDKLFRIKSIVAEVQIDSSWIIHQITNIAYNSSDKVEQINYIRYEKSLDSLIITYIYESDGLIISEVAQSLNRTDSIWNKAWMKAYQWVDKRLFSYDLIDIDKNYWLGPNRVEFVYDEKSRPIESIEYEFINNSLKKDRNYTWKYDIQNKLIEHNISGWKNSNWVLNYHEYYEYDEQNRLKSRKSITYDTKGGQPFKFEKSYFYISSVNIDSVQNAKMEYERDSSNQIFYTIIENDSNGFLKAYLRYSSSDRRSENRKVVIERDEFNNVVLVRDKNFKQNKLSREQNMRAVYGKKKY